MGIRFDKAIGIPFYPAIEPKKYKEATISPRVHRAPHTHRVSVNFDKPPGPNSDDRLRVYEMRLRISVLFMPKRNSYKKKKKKAYETSTGTTKYQMFKF